MSAYLKQTSTVTGERRNTFDKYASLISIPNASANRPFEMASDEDLLASNYDRISKILPSNDHLNE